MQLVITIKRWLYHNNSVSFVASARSLQAGGTIFPLAAEAETLPALKVDLQKQLDFLADLPLKGSALDINYCVVQLPTGRRVAWEDVYPESGDLCVKVDG